MVFTSYHLYASEDVVIGRLTAGGQRLAAPLVLYLLALIEDKLAIRLVCIGTCWTKWPYLTRIVENTCYVCFHGFVWQSVPRLSSFVNDNVRFTGHFSCQKVIVCCISFIACQKIPHNLPRIRLWQKLSCNAYTVEQFNEYSCQSLISSIVSIFYHRTVPQELELSYGNTWIVW